MSNTENTEIENNPLQEVTRKVVITPEDVAGAAEFWTHFEIPMPASLREAFDSFSKNPCIETQDLVKREVAMAIAHTDHEAFKDEMFQEIVQECSMVGYDMSFDEALEETLSQTEENNK